MFTGYAGAVAWRLFFDVESERPRLPVSTRSTSGSLSAGIGGRMECGLVFGVVVVVDGSSAEAETSDGNGAS